MARPAPAAPEPMRVLLQAHKPPLKAKRTVRAVALKRVRMLKWLRPKPRAPKRRSKMKRSKTMLQKVRGNLPLALRLKATEEKASHLRQPRPPLRRMARKSKPPPAISRTQMARDRVPNPIPTLRLLLPLPAPARLNVALGLEISPAV